MNIDYKRLTARIDDLIAQSKDYNIVTETNFLTFEEQAILKNYVGKKHKFTIWGGYENAEYCKVYFGEINKFNIVCLKAKFDSKYNSITHRDILGALMSLSINRNQIGDFFVEDEFIYLYTTENFMMFLIDNFTNIKNITVKFEASDIFKSRIVKTQYFEKIISSPRIDNIVSAIMNCSRKEAQEIIRDDRVKINHIVIAEMSKLCNNDCIISIKGKGRFIYKGIIKITKKENILIGIEKFI